MPFPLVGALPYVAGAAGTAAAIPTVAALNHNKPAPSGYTEYFNGVDFADTDPNDLPKSLQKPTTTPTTVWPNDLSSYSFLSPTAPSQPQPQLFGGVGYNNNLFGSGSNLATDTPQTASEEATPQTATTGAVAPQASATTPAPATNKPTLTLDQVARGVVAGKYGNGANRKSKIEALGLNYGDVQKSVNALMQGTSTGTNKLKAKKKEDPKKTDPGNDKNTGNWMDTLNNLLPYLALAGGAYYASRKL